jgi:deoxycytidylate deaminase
MNVSWFRLAKQIAELSDHPTYKMGALIGKQRPVAIGANMMKSHPVFADGERWYSIHAEMKALVNAKCSVDGHDIYVYREDAEGNPALAKPCDECMAVLIEAGIKNIYFSNAEGSFSVIRL